MNRLHGWWKGMQVEWADMGTVRECMRYIFWRNALLIWNIGSRECLLFVVKVSAGQRELSRRAKARDVGWGVGPGGMNMHLLQTAWERSFEFPTSCHVTGTQRWVCRKGLMLETFGMIKRRQTVFSMIWMGCRELQNPRWDMIKAWTKCFAESLAGYSRIWLDRFYRFQTRGTKSRPLCGFAWQFSGLWSLVKHESMKPCLLVGDHYKRNACQY